jgi:hypothetical protein
MNRREKKVFDCLPHRCVITARKLCHEPEGSPLYRCLHLHSSKLHCSKPSDLCTQKTEMWADKRYLKETKSNWLKIYSSMSPRRLQPLLQPIMSWPDSGQTHKDPWKAKERVKHPRHWSALTQPKKCDRQAIKLRKNTITPLLKNKISYWETKTKPNHVKWGTASDKIAIPIATEVCMDFIFHRQEVVLCGFYVPIISLRLKLKVLFQTLL